MLSEIVPKTTFWAKNKNQHPILNPGAKFELNWLRKNKSYGKTSFLWNEWAELGYKIWNDVILKQCLWLYSNQVSLLSDTKW